MSSEVETAERLLRWYPRTWRDRYGEEFTELLVAEIGERPQSWRRTADVAINGLLARASLAGLGRGPVTDITTTLAITGCVTVGFAMGGLSLWSQLVATSHSGPAGPAAGVGLLVLTASIGYLLLVAATAALGLLGPLGRALRGPERAGVIRPLAACFASAATLVAGGLHVAAHGSTRGARGIPPGLAGFVRAETLSINTYWAHPSLLGLLHPALLAWMLVSPVALALLLAATTTVVRRLELPPDVVRLETRLALAALAGMVAMLAASGWWVLTSQHTSNTAVQTGTLDLALIAVMAIALAAVTRTSRRLARR